uniref:Uncharacterized protein n=1 Tax=Oryza sativa subsp. japonica TaxID=39947 RepID=Q6KAE8_ORYSJ|nr:hypothetical protein [Oryza sativa Japonica Group]
MGLRDGLSDNKLLDDFGCGEIQPVQVMVEYTPLSRTFSTNTESSHPTYQRRPTTYLITPAMAGLLEKRKILFDIIEDSMSLWFYTKID